LAFAPQVEAAVAAVWGANYPETFSLGRLVCHFAASTFEATLAETEMVGSRIVGAELGRQLSTRQPDQEVAEHVGYFGVRLPARFEDFAPHTARDEVAFAELQREAAVIQLEDLTRDVKGESISVNYRLTRSDLDAIASRVLQPGQASCLALLRRCGWQSSELSDLILVGRWCLAARSGRACPSAGHRANLHGGPMDDGCSGNRRPGQRHRAAPAAHVSRL
jgi:hypothetical protein